MLIKNAEALQRFEKVDTLVIDKTGTLTEGKPRLTAVAMVGGFDEATIISLGASLENTTELDERASGLRKEGATALFVAVDRRLAGIIG